MVPVIIPETSGADAAAVTVVEIDRDAFLSVLRQGTKPLVFEHHAGFPKTFRYLTRMGPYFFLYRARQADDLSAHATVLPVKNFFTHPSAVT
jgi:hypothetical protein